MARYGKKSQEKVEKAMHERKTGNLKSGRSGKKVTSRKQAIAIGLSEARREGGKVPKKTNAKSKAGANQQSRTGSQQRSTRAKSGGRKRTSSKQRKAS